MVRVGNFKNSGKAFLKARGVMKKMMMIVASLVGLLVSNKSYCLEKQEVSIESKAILKCEVLTLPSDNLNDDYLRPKWWNNIGKVIRGVGETIAGIGLLWDKLGDILWPPGVISTNGDGNVVDYYTLFDTSIEGLSSMKEYGIKFSDGKLSVPVNIVVAENDLGQQIFLKSGNYFLDKSGVGKVAYTNVAK